MKLFILALLAVSAIAIPTKIRPDFYPLEGRIVGGEEATPGQFPYIISLRRFGGHICGGSIYNENFIITAAHCVDSGSASSYEISAGDHDKSSVDGSEQIIDVEEIIIHENYDTPSNANDIALLKLAGSLELSGSVSAVALPQQGEEFDGQSATVAGWGTTSSGGTTPDILRYVVVDIIPDQECDNDYNLYGGIDDATMICAGVEEGGKDSCQGDSGGPMTCSGLLCGIVSWGVGCARAEYPGVYTQASTFITWITTNTS